MALANCRECGRQISNEAKICPNCGAKRPVPSAQRGWVYLVIIGVVLGGMVASWLSPTPATQAQEAQKAAEDPAKKAAEDADHERKQSAAMAVAVVKRSMRNPESFQLIQVLVMPATGATCIEYRAQNGFGGMNVEHAIARKGQLTIENSDGFQRAWNAGCGNQYGDDITSAVRIMTGAR